MTVGIINKTLTASFVFCHPVGGTESITLDLSGNNILPGKPFLVEISRLIEVDRSIIIIMCHILRVSLELIETFTSFYKILKLKVYTVHLVQSLV